VNELDRWKLLAAETFGYSYDNYAGHRGNRQFDQYMPDDVRLLDRACREAWPLERLANELDQPEEDASEMLESFRKALEVVDAPTPAESFRRSVREDIQQAVAEGIESEEKLEALVVQICFRVADLSFRLQSRDEPLHKYSELLRREPGVKYHNR